MVQKEIDRINRINRMVEMEEEELTEKIIGCAMKVHSGLGPGFLESVYAKALAYELRKAGLKVECEKLITVK
jgi:GxxExxY protein